MGVTLYLVGAVIVSAVAHGYAYTRLPRLKWPLIAMALLPPLGMAQLSYMRVIPRAIAAPLMWAAFTWLGVLYFLLLTLIATHRLRPSPWLLAPPVCIAAVAMWQALRPPEVVDVHIGFPVRARI